MKVVRLALVATVAMVVGALVSAGAAGAAPWRYPFPPPTTLVPSAIPGWAGYYSNNFEGTVSTVVTVPSIDCSANPIATFEGQAEGVQFFNNFNGSMGLGDVTAAGVVRTYCDGPTPTYDTAFFMPTSDDSSYLYVPSTVVVDPGDAVLISVTVSDTDSSASIRDLSACGCGSFDAVTGGAVTDAGPNVGIVALGVDGGGADNLGANSSETVPPPAPSSPVRFSFSQAGGAPLFAMPGLLAQEWTDSGDTTEVHASPTPLWGGNFGVTNGS